MSHLQIQLLGEFHLQYEGALVMREATWVKYLQERFVNFFQRSTSIIADAKARKPFLYFQYRHGFAGYRDAFCEIGIPLCTEGDYA